MLLTKHEKNTQETELILKLMSNRNQTLLYQVVHKSVGIKLFTSRTLSLRRVISRYSRRGDTPYKLVFINAVIGLPDNDNHLRSLKEWVA